MTTFVVTGASSGIGRATAAALADRGVEVLAVARRSAALDDIAAEHPTVRPVVADLATDDGINRLIAAVDSAERIDGLVHGAGSLVPVEPYQDLDADELSRHFRLHVAVPIEINGRLRDRLDGARVVYIDSLSAAAPRVGWSAYSIVKAAAQMAARAAAMELGDVDVVRVFPGGVRTPLVEGVLRASASAPVAAAFRALDADGALAEPDTIGNWIASIALDTTRAELAATDSWHFGDPNPATTHTAATD